MANFNFYRAEANWYIRIIRQDDNAVYDNAAGAFAAAPTWANSSIVLTWNAVIEGYPVVLPELAPSVYDIVFYDNATPASGDIVEYGQEWSVL